MSALHAQTEKTPPNVSFRVKPTQWVKYHAFAEKRGVVLSVLLRTMLDAVVEVDFEAEGSTGITFRIPDREA